MMLSYASVSTHYRRVRSRRSNAVPAEEMICKVPYAGFEMQKHAISRHAPPTHPDHPRGVSLSNSSSFSYHPCPTHLVCLGSYRVDLMTKVVPYPCATFVLPGSPPKHLSSGEGSLCLTITDVLAPPTFFSVSYLELSTPSLIFYHFSYPLPFFFYPLQVYHIRTSRQKEP